jgi:N-formylglutamate deformylase
MEPYRYIPGTVPVVVSIPHVGTAVPDDILERFTPRAKQLPDTDWHVDRLYDFASALGVHVIAANYSRYVVDLNRDPNGQSLYPGQFTTGLCPATLFDESPLYETGQTPDAQEISQRVGRYWQPYHHKISTLLEELRAQSPRVVLFDAHSIASQVPSLFEGRLPDLNLGTDGGRTADSNLIASMRAVCEKSGYSHVLNGRFKGGYITRHYARPEQGVHTVQLELAQCNYMDETYPFAYNEAKAAQLQALLKPLISCVCDWALQA